MKKIIAILLCLILIFSLTACGKDEDKLLEGEEVLFDISSEITPDVSSSDLASSEDSSTQSGTEDGETSSSSDTEVDLNNTDSNSDSAVEEGFNTGMQLVDGKGVYYFPNINETYEYAAKIYADLLKFTFSYDEQLGVYEIVKDGSTGYYWRVNDSRFDSVAELERYLDVFFTKDCQKTFYDPSRFIDHNGHLYASIGAVADSNTYAGCSFKLTKQTTKRIFFEGTAYYYKSPEEVDNEQPLFTAAPADASKYETKTYEFELIINEEGTSWQFSKFAYLG